MSAPRRIVVVGASLAGLRGLEALRREGYAGELVLVGEEPHAPYDRPPLSKQLLAGTLEPEQIALHHEPWDELDVDLRFGARAVRLDAKAREVVLADDARVAYDGLLIATGARARPLPGAPPLRGIHLLRSLDDALALRAALDASPHVLIVGAGFIGAEVAATCRGRGLGVTMVEPLAAPMVRGLGLRLGRLAAELHRDHGVDLRCGVGVETLEGAGRVERARLSDGSTVETQLVLVGIGAQPNTEWLEGSGLEIRGGVVCDATCATALPGVTAAGDVARFPHALLGEEVRIEHWTHAIEMGEAAALRLLRKASEAGPFGGVPYVWTDQYDRKLQIAGRVGEDDVLHVLEGTLEERRFAAVFERRGRVSAAVAMNRPAALMRLKRRMAEGVRLDEVLAG